MKPTVKAFFDEKTYTVTYVVMDPSSHICAIIDPVLDFDQPSGRTSTASADQVLDFIQDNNLEVTWILESQKQMAKRLPAVLSPGFRPPLKTYSSSATSLYQMDNSLIAC